MRNVRVAMWSGSLVVSDDPTVAEREFCK
jgi:hypothetical protein